MRALNSQRPRHPTFTILALSSLFILLAVLHGSWARSVGKPAGDVSDEGVVSEGKAENVPSGVVLAGVTEVQREKVSSVLSERSKTEGDAAEKKVAFREGDAAEKHEIQGDEPGEKLERVASEGIRRFDAEVVAEGGTDEAPKKVSVNPKGIHIGSETHVEVSEIEDNTQLYKESPKRVIKSYNRQEEKLKRARSEDVGEKQSDQAVLASEESRETGQVVAEKQKDEIVPTDEESQKPEVRVRNVDVQVRNVPVSVNDQNKEMQIQDEGDASRIVDSVDVKSIREEGSTPFSEIQGAESRKVINISPEGLGTVGEPQILERPAQSVSNEQVQGQETVLVEAGKEVRDVPVQEVAPRNSAPAVKSEGNYSIIEFLKEQSLLFQDQIRNNTLFQRIKEPIFILPEIPLLTEIEILDALKSISSSKKISHHDLNIEPFTSDLLNDKQKEIIQCSAQLIEEIPRQSFISSLYKCVRNLSMMNCLRIFVYPIIAENMPNLILQNIPNLPLEVSISDLLPSKNKTKSARAGMFMLYPVLTAEEVVTGILKDTLKSNRTYESVPSYIDPVNETFANLLTPGRLTILMMAEKFLPVTARKEYSEKMYSCIQRFEYFSCMKYFAWPMMKQYYSTLPDFPDYQLLYPLPEYPIVPFPLEPGQLPEVVAADAVGLKSRPEALLMRILQSGVKPGRPSTGEIQINRGGVSPQIQIPYEQLLKSSADSDKRPMFDNLSPGGSRISQDQFTSVLVSKKIIPPPLRSEFISQSLKCIEEFNYLTCMKYYTWPVVRQFQPSFPEFPNLQELFQIPDFSQFFQLPSWVQIPNIPSFGQGGIPAIPGIPTLPEIPVGVQPPAPAPAGPSEPTPANEIKQDEVPQQLIVLESLPVNDATTIRTPLEKPEQEFELRHSSVEPAEEQDQENILESANSAKKPVIQFSSRKSEMETNVPVISVTGTEFVPIASENPETVIFTMLRLYQLSNQNLMHTLAIPFLNFSTPEYASFLNLHQENTILLANNMLPESARSSFFENMISCARINSFVSCSRDIMFPTLAEYFPNLPSFPSFGASQNSQTIMDSNASDSIADSPAISETNVKTDRHGDATVTITDTRFVPIFSEHPEAMVINILKQVQISGPNSPPGLLKTREILKLPEFQNSLTEEQIEILETSESLLPEHLREVFVKRMIVCARNNIFLDCTRDIGFPTVAQFFPRLPNFPSFRDPENLLEQKIQGSEISPALHKILPGGLHKPEIKVYNSDLLQTQEHLQNEIENILLRSAPLNSRSQTSARVTADSPLYLVPGVLTQQQANIMRLSESIIPDSIRPEYRTTMLECIRSNPFLPCVEHITWPTIRLTNLHLPNFPKLEIITQFPDPIPPPKFPLNALPAPLSPVNPYTLPAIDLLSRQYGQNPFFGQVIMPAIPHQQPEQPELTSSVGKQILPTEIPAYAGQPSANFIGLLKEEVNPENNVDLNPAKLEALSIEHNRRKRSPEDLEESYPEHDPDENKGSVRKNLVKSTFPNMTESEFLQLLIRISHSQEHQQRTPLTKSKKYFVDNLNPEVKNSLTADQYQIMKFVEDLNQETARAGFMSRLVQCALSLSVMRCIGIFVWPMIVSNLPSLPFIGRAHQVDVEIQEFFGMPPVEFEKELLVRKEEFEDVLVSWYKTVVEQKFETNIGFLRIKGHGNGELTISLAGSREGRAKIIKDNKNLPSILTFISDIMEDVIDHRPNNDKLKKDPKRNRSMRGFEESDNQVLRDSEDVKFDRSTKDDRILASFLEKLRTNDSEIREDGSGQYFSNEDAFHSFELLFGTRLASGISSKLKSFGENHLRSLIDKNVEDQNPEDDELKIVPLKAQEKILEEKLKIVPFMIPQTFYDLDEENGKTTNAKKELSKGQFAKDDSFRNQEKSKNGYKESGTGHKKKHRTELSIQLPRLNDVVFSRKITSSVLNIGRGIKTKMMQMMPGIGMVMTFLVQMVLSHARTAASVAGMLSNLALGMGMLGMIRQTLFGDSNNPKIKYVYDTESVGPGISWPKKSHENSWKWNEED